MEQFITLDEECEYTSTPTYQNNDNSKLNEKSYQYHWSSQDETEKSDSKNDITNSFKFIRKKQVNNNNDTILAKKYI
ncbi:MAG: hypothetical protein EBX50_20065 [Chitinophagia bacterium]|nr:hypothetical protein [Chitinophagia bacterium]